MAYVGPLEERGEDRLLTTDDIRDLAMGVVGAMGGGALSALVDAALRVAARAIEKGRRKVTVLADDIFQAV